MKEDTIKQRETFKEWWKLLEKTKEQDHNKWRNQLMIQDKLRKNVKDKIIKDMARR